MDMAKDHEFKERILRMAGHEVQTCIQCGTCSASCPTAPLMQPSIRSLVKLCLDGKKEKALNCDTLWLCTSCLLCTVRCPRGIRPKAVVSALKTLAEAEGEKVEAPDGIYERLFLKQIYDNGRISEIYLTASFLVADPKAMLQSMQMGIELLAKGKISLEVDRVHGQDEIKRIIKGLGGR